MKTNYIICMIVLAGAFSKCLIAETQEALETLQEEYHKPTGRDAEKIIEASKIPQELTADPTKIVPAHPVVGPAPSAPAVVPAAARVKTNEPVVAPVIERSGAPETAVKVATAEKKKAEAESQITEQQQKKRRGAKKKKAAEEVKAQEEAKEKRAKAKKVKEDEAKKKAAAEKEPPAPKKPKRQPRPRGTVPTNLVDFTFDDDDLVEAVRRVAEKKRVNVILPQQAAAIKQKITFKPGRLLTIDEAEKYLYLFLDYAGYTVSPGKDFALVIKNKEAQVNQLPLYVFDPNGILKAEDLPQNDSFVRVVYYLANLKVDDQPSNSVLVVLKELLSSPTNVFVDPISNALVISDKSRVVISALQLLRELDGATAKHTLVALQLYNANAVYVATLLNTQIFAAGGKSRFGLSDGKSPGVGSYFSTSIRVVPDPRRNTLIIMGKEAPVNRLKDFVREYMDVPIGTGKSFFHSRDLDFLDAQSFAEVLTSVVQSVGMGDQKTVERVGGAHRYFEGVVIRAETYTPVEIPPQTPSSGGGNEFEQKAVAGTVYRGGNRLLVASSPSDWEQLINLIDQLDVPQRQVILEVLIVDYTRNEDKALQSQVRSLERFDFLTGAGFQAAHISNPPPLSGIIPSVDCGLDLLTKQGFLKNAAATVANATNQAANAAKTAAQSVVDGVKNGAATAAQQLQVVGTCPVTTTITGDLLRCLGDSSTTCSTLIPQDPGTFAVSFNDPAGTGIWGLLTLLNNLGHAKILSHPYLIALNNTTSQVYNSVIRRTQGEGNSASGGAIQVNIRDIPAILSLTLTPRISSMDRLNLELVVQIEQFTNQVAGFTRNSRTLTTNVNMSPGQVLVLGGLTRVTKVQQATETPILGRIPIIGWFFRGDQQTQEETELGIFVRPTIIDPRRREAMGDYTRRKIKGGLRPLDDSFMGNRKDPVIRFFFGTCDRERGVVDDYMRENDIAPAPEVVPAPPPIWEDYPLHQSDTFQESLAKGAVASP